MHAGRGRAWQRAHPQHLARHPFLGVRPKKHSLISTPRMRAETSVHRCAYLPAWYRLKFCGSPFTDAHHGGQETLYAAIFSAKLLQQSPENVPRVATADLLSLRPEISLLLAESAAANFERVHLIAVIIVIWTASMRIYMLFVSMKELDVGCAVCSRAACMRESRSILRRPSTIIASGCRDSLFGTRCLRGHY